jgi:hypothetical protein
MQNPVPLPDTIGAVIVLLAIALYAYFGPSTLLLHCRKLPQHFLRLREIDRSLMAKSTGPSISQRATSFCAAVPCISLNSVSKIFCLGFASFRFRTNPTSLQPNCSFLFRVQEL